VSFLGIYNTGRKAEMISYEGNRYYEQSCVVLPLQDMLKQVVEKLSTPEDFYQLLRGNPLQPNKDTFEIDDFKRAVTNAWLKLCARDFFKYTIRTLFVLVQFSEKEGYTCIANSKDFEEAEEDAEVDLVQQI
jgi:hypothetical protein